jgi:N-hydroxyarylamine O-acetyltransferase
MKSAIMMADTMRLNDYLDRLESRRAPGRVALHADVETLRRLHFAHRETFLFENLTIQTGGHVSLALGDLERKFLDEGRGGYCFEHNTLFAAVLREAGLNPVTLLGRVRRGPPESWARTHMVLRVPVGPGSDDVWLADVGFGAIGLLEPMPLRDGATSIQGGFEYALRREPFVWVLSMRDATSTTDLYEFADDPQTPQDVEVANHFTATHPDSVFRRTLTIQRASRTGRLVLRHDVLSRYRNGETREEPIDPGRVRELARELFGIALPSEPLLFERCSAPTRPQA